MRALAVFLRRRPRWSLALGLGLATSVLAFWSWEPISRLSGAVPAITLGAGLAHALAGAWLGRRLFDRARTASSADAALLGAAGSVLALCAFAPAFAFWVGHGGGQARGPMNLLALTAYIGFFSFFAGGWALLLVSAAVSALLWEIAAHGAARPGDRTPGD